MLCYYKAIMPMTTTRMAYASCIQNHMWMLKYKAKQIILAFQQQTAIFHFNFISIQLLVKLPKIIMHQGQQNNVYVELKLC